MLRDKLRDTVARRDQERVELLRDLVQIRSVTGGESEIQGAVETAFERAGLEVRRQCVDVSRVSEQLRGMRDRDFEGRSNVIGVLRGSGGGRSLLLNAHVDTVLPGESSRWTHPPFDAVLDDGAVWGRGACDMKAGLVACLHAVLAIRDAELRLKGDVVIAATVAEESGGAGAVAFALDEPRTDAAIVTEPTGLCIAPAHAGAMQWRVTLEGRSAHACVRSQGVSAMEKFVALFGFLRQYEEERVSEVDHPLFAAIDNPVPLNVGVVQAGDNVTVVPERLVAEGRIGMMPGEDLDSVQRDFEDRILNWAAGDAWLREHPPAIEWGGVRFAASETPEHHPLVETARTTFEAVLDRPAEVRGMTYGTDMSHFIGVSGVPTILFGPGDMALAHQADERVPVEELHAATRVLAATAAAWCG